MAVVVRAVAMPGVTLAAVIMGVSRTRAGASPLKTFFLREIVHQSDCTRMRPATHTLDCALGRGQLREHEVAGRAIMISRFALLRE